MLNFKEFLNCLIVSKIWINKRVAISYNVSNNNFCSFDRQKRTLFITKNEESIDFIANDEENKKT